MVASKPDSCENRDLGLCVVPATHSCICCWIWYNFIIYFTNTHKSILHVNIHKVQISGFTALFPFFSSYKLL